MSGTTLLTSWEDQEPEDAGDGFTVIKLSAGDPHTRAIFDAVVDRYNVVADRPRPTAEELEGFVDEKVTLIQHGENMMGGGIIAAEEGKLFRGAGGVLGILPKGKRTKGLRVNPDRVLDILPGYQAAPAQVMVTNVRMHFPPLKALTQERLEQLPAESGSMLDLCLFGTYRMPDGQQTDALCLWGEYDRENDIVDTGVVLLRPEIGVSEHGSAYGRDLLRVHLLGEVLGYSPITFGEAIELCNLPYEDAFERVLGNCVAA